MLMPPNGLRVVKKNRLLTELTVQIELRQLILILLESEIKFITHGPTGIILPCTARLHYSGSNRGDTIYGVKMPSFDSENVWKLSFGDKKKLYAKHRVAVGGASPEGVEAEGEIIKQN